MHPFYSPVMWQVPNTGLSQAPSVNQSLKTINFDQGLSSYSLRPKSYPVPDFVNKVLLKYSHTHSFTCYLWLFLHYYGRSRVAVKENIEPPKLVYYLTLYRKFANSWLRAWHRSEFITQKVVLSFINPDKRKWNHFQNVQLH